MYRIGRPGLYLALFITALIEGTLLGRLSAGHVRPDLMIILVIFVAFHSDLRQSLEAAAVGGLLRGVMTTDSLAVNMAVFIALGFFASYLKDKLFRDSPIAQFLVTFFAAALFNAFVISAKTVLGGIKPTAVIPRQVFFKISFAAGLYTAIFAPPVFFILKRLLGRREARFRL